MRVEHVSSGELNLFQRIHMYKATSLLYHNTPDRNYFKKWSNHRLCLMHISDEALVQCMGVPWVVLVGEAGRVKGKWHWYITTTDAAHWKMVWLGHDLMGLGGIGKYSSTGCD